MRVSSSKRGGFTLIEVIIAMAIFVIGAVAIVRIFPPALAALQGSQDRSNATRLASGQIERFRLRAANSTLPDSIYNGDTNGGYDDSFGGAFVGTVNSNLSLPRNVQKGTGTALDQGRYIDGERQRVMEDADGNVFLLTNFPYAANSLKISIEDASEGVRVRDADSSSTATKYVFDFSDSTRVSDGASWSNPNSGAQPEGNKYPRGTGPQYRYYISYRWEELVGGQRRVQSVIDEPYVFPEPSAVGADALKSVRDQAVPNIVEGEVDVRFIFTIPADTDSTADASSVLNMSSTDDEVRGIFAFDGGGIKAGDVVRVSYRVAFDPSDPTLGWRGLVVDQAPAGGAVSLSTRGLDENFYGDTVYTLAYAAPNNSGESDGELRRGDCAPNTKGECSETDSAIKSFINAGNETNRLIFKDDATATAVNEKGLADLVAPRARVVYRPQDGWGVQVSVAARSYMPFVGFALPTNNGYQSEKWRAYSWKSGSPDLYFQPGEAGKTILVSYEYLDGTVYRAVKDAVVTVGADLQNSAAISAALVTGFTGAGGNVSRAELLDKKGDPVANVTAITAVRGASVQARTVWADNQGRYSQTVVTDYRKRG